MNEEQKIIETLDQSVPKLTSMEKEDLWHALETKLPSAPTPSPYTKFFTTKKHLAPIAFALVFVLSGTGVVAAAENSRPGDSLFVIEQRVEDIRLALASDDGKTRLEAEFAAERLLELSSILNETVRRETNATTEASTTPNHAVISEESEVRVNDAVAITLDYLLNSSFGDDTREDFLEELSLLIEGVPVKLHNDRLRIEDKSAWIEIREDDDDESRIEIRDENNRIRIREKDGEIRIDTKGDWDDENDDVNVSGDNLDDKDDDDDYRQIKTDDRDKDDDYKISNQFEAEADVFADTTIVKVEINGRKSTFETTAKTRGAVVAEIVSRFGITQTTVEAGLDFEIEDNTTDNDSDEDTEQDDDNNEPELTDEQDGDRATDLDDDEDDRGGEDNVDEDTTDISIEVRVEDGKAEVRAEGSHDDEFTLPYTTKTILITAIALRTGLSEAIVSSNLDLEFKD